MKKTLYLLLSVLLAIAMTACGSKTEEKTTDPVTTYTLTAGDTLTVGSKSFQNTVVLELADGTTDAITIFRFCDCSFAKGLIIKCGLRARVELDENCVFQPDTGITVNEAFSGFTRTNDDTAVTALWDVPGGTVITASGSVAVSGNQPCTLNGNSCTANGFSSGRYRAVYRIDSDGKSQFSIDEDTD